MRDKAGARVRPPLLQLHRRGGLHPDPAPLLGRLVLVPQDDGGGAGAHPVAELAGPAGSVQRGGQAHQHNGHPPGQRRRRRAQQASVEGVSR
jgi:hypothetical protein